MGKAVRNPGRWRRAVGYMLLLACAIATAGWLVSGSYTSRLDLDASTMELFRGVVTVDKVTPGPNSEQARLTQRRIDEQWGKRKYWHEFSWETHAKRWGMSWSAANPPSVLYMAPTCDWNVGIAARYRFGRIGFTRVAIWPVPALLGIGGASLLWHGLRARRRARKGLCKRCGYSLAGLPAGAACPECGARARPRGSPHSLQTGETPMG